MVNNNFKSYLGFLYDRKYFCEQNGCHFNKKSCDCSKIVNFRISSINLQEITDEIYLNRFGDKRTKSINKLLGINDILIIYSIDRIIRVNKIWNKYNWTPSIISGYYGEEIEEVKLSKKIYKKIKSEIDILAKVKSKTEIINFLLNIEYGHVLDKVKNYSYSYLKTISLSDINIGNREYLNGLNSNTYELNNTGIMGILYSDGDRFGLIDGYHRYKYYSEAGIKSGLYIVLST